MEKVNFITFLLRLLGMARQPKLCLKQQFTTSDLDIIFSLFNTEDFTIPFQNGDNLFEFMQRMNNLHAGMLANRHADPSKHLLEVNLIFYNLSALIVLGNDLVYDMINWHFFLIDALRFNTLKIVNSLLDEYNYTEYIYSYRLCAEAPLVIAFLETKVNHTGKIISQMSNIKNYLIKYKVNPEIVDDYLHDIRLYIQ